MIHSLFKRRITLRLFLFKKYLENRAEQVSDIFLCLKDGRKHCLLTHFYSTMGPAYTISFIQYIVNVEVQNSRKTAKEVFRCA